MSASPLRIHFIRPLFEVPALHDAIAQTLPAVDTGGATLIGADAEEYVHVPSDDTGFFFMEAVRHTDGRYALVTVSAQRARAIVKAACEYRLDAPARLAS